MKKIGISSAESLNLAIGLISRGGLLMHPTETCYGLAVDIFNESALGKLYRVKGMPAEKPLSILVDGIGMAQEYGIFSDKALELAQRYWPGSLSIMVPRKRKLPAFFNKGSDFVSIRCSSLDFCSNLVKALGSPVTTTSANSYGEPELYLPKSIIGIDLLVDGGELFGSRPSTIVKIDNDLVEIIRQGDIASLANELF